MYVLNNYLCYIIAYLCRTSVALNKIYHTSEYISSSNLVKYTYMYVLLYQYSLQWYSGEQFQQEKRCYELTNRIFHAINIVCKGI